MSATLAALLFVASALAAATIYKYPPQGWSNQNAGFSGVSSWGGCTAYWSFSQAVDDVYAYYYSENMEVHWSQLYAGNVSGNQETWYYHATWVYGDGPADAFYHYDVFEGSSPIFEPGSTLYAYQNNNGIVIQTNFGEFGDPDDCDSATSWLVLWGPN
jgi:hypothetical protein